MMTVSTNVYSFYFLCLNIVTLIYMLFIIILSRQHVDGNTVDCENHD